MPAETVIKLRRGTASQWTTANPVLAAGEMGVETDTNRSKFGDGATAWTSLTYTVGDSSGVGTIDWTSVLNKPTEFTPSAHTHVKTDITDFAHTHVKADITDFAHTHTASEITDIETYVDGRVNLVIDGAPAALDTLNELAAALNDDANFASTITNMIDEARKTATIHTFMLMGA